MNSAAHMLRPFVVDCYGRELASFPTFIGAVLFARESIRDVRGIRLVNYAQVDEGHDGLTEEQREDWEEALALSLSSDLPTSPSTELDPLDELEHCVDQIGLCVAGSDGLGAIEYVQRLRDVTRRLKEAGK